MASKLDELMALADVFWEHGTNEALAHAEGSGYDGEKVNAARTALQSALKAVVEDATRLEGLRKSLEWDGHGYWLPDLCVKERACGEDFTPEPTPEEFRAAIDAARKP